jgi:hypothetical protein
MNNRKLIIFSLLFFVLDVCAIAQEKIEQWKRFEIVLKHTPAGNAFNDVSLRATFTGPDTTYVVAGFYDDNNTYKIRFMPQKTGTWSYTTSSNVKTLNNQKGNFECVKAAANNHGIVRVRDTYSFNYADGKPFYPFGTTAYAWTHMGKGLQEKTLLALKKSGFNKVRMCVFPKNYDLVKEEPEAFPFAVTGTTKDANNNTVIVWDFNQFNPEFFQRLEKRIDDLNELGIEADLILFHPYDKGRWGFDAMPREVNIRYVQYLSARLASFKNVWWSLANEWDYVLSKTIADWDNLTQTIIKADPYRHLCSIHGATATYYNYLKPEFTHVSVQDEAPVQSPNSAAIVRNVYHKPVIYDEVGYEGNLKSRWGRYSGEEMTHLVWNGVVAGTYVTHGETFMSRDATDTIFWAKGGDLKGTSWQRIAFLRKIIEACPGPLSLADVSRDNITASAGEGYYILYFGKQVNDSWLFNLPAKNGTLAKLKAGTRFKVDIIDTWEMTIESSPLIFETSAENDYRLLDKDLKKVRLPLKPYIALRITELKK